GVRAHLGAFDLDHGLMRLHPRRLQKLVHRDGIHLLGVGGPTGELLQLIEGDSDRPKLQGTFEAVAPPSLRDHQSLAEQQDDPYAQRSHDVLPFASLLFAPYAGTSRSLRPSCRNAHDRRKRSRYGRLNGSTFTAPVMSLVSTYTSVSYTVVSAS